MTKVEALNYLARITNQVLNLLPDSKIHFPFYPGSPSIYIFCTPEEFRFNWENYNKPELRIQTSMGVNDVVFVVDDVKYFCPATKLGAKKVSDEKWDFGVEDEAK